MPELPEVETIVRELAPRLEGYRIVRARLNKSDVLRRVSKPRLLRFRPQAGRRAHLDRQRFQRARPMRFDGLPVLEPGAADALRRREPRPCIGIGCNAAYAEVAGLQLCVGRSTNRSFGG